MSNYCKICHKMIIGGYFNYQAHNYQHGSVLARFTCKFCSKAYFRKDVYKLHLLKHITEKRKDFLCDYCGSRFGSKTNLKRHLKVHDSCPSKEYECTACGACYSEERLLRHHVRKTHFNLTEIKLVHVNKEPNETWIERVNNTEECVFMTKVNNNVISIKKCDKIKSESKKCMLLTRDKTNHKDYFNKMAFNTQYSKATCDYCKKEMLKKSIRNHIRERHLRMRNFKCECCKKSFNRRYQMTQHECGKVERRRKTILVNCQGPCET